MNSSFFGTLIQPSVLNRVKKLQVLQKKSSLVLHSYNLLFLKFGNGQYQVIMSSDTHRQSELV